MKESCHSQVATAVVVVLVATAEDVHLAVFAFFATQRPPWDLH